MKSPPKYAAGAFTESHCSQSLGAEYPVAMSNWGFMTTLNVPQKSRSQVSKLCTPAGTVVIGRCGGCGERRETHVRMWEAMLCHPDVSPSHALGLETSDAVADRMRFLKAHVSCTGAVRFKMPDDLLETQNTILNVSGTIIRNGQRVPEMLSLIVDGGPGLLVPMDELPTSSASRRIAIAEMIELVRVRMKVSRTELLGAIHVAQAWKREITVATAGESHVQNPTRVLHVSVACHAAMLCLAYPINDDSVAPLGEPECGVPQYCPPLDGLFAR